MQQAGTAGVQLDSMEFGRRLAVEKELEKQALESVLEGRAGSTATIGQPAWDEGGKFVIYPTMLGIKGAFLSAFESSLILTTARSRQHGHEQGRADTREGRDGAVQQPGAVPGHAYEAGRQDHRAYSFTRTFDSR